MLWPPALRTHRVSASSQLWDLVSPPAFWIRAQGDWTQCRNKGTFWTSIKEWRGRSLCSKAAVFNLLGTRDLVLWTIIFPREGGGDGSGGNVSNGEGSGRWSFTHSLPFTSYFAVQFLTGRRPWLGGSLLSTCSPGQAIVGVDLWDSCSQREGRSSLGELVDRSSCRSSAGLLLAAHRGHLQWSYWPQLVSSHPRTELKCGVQAGNSNPKREVQGLQTASYRPVTLD